MHQRSFEVATPGRGTVDITAQVERIVADARVHKGLAHVFVQHTSASLILCENADPAVRVDLETWMARMAPDGDASFTHRSEGPDDMPAHVRSVLTQSALSLPVTDGHLALGTWQGLFLWEHRNRPHTRTLTVTVHGDSG